MKFLYHRSSAVVLMALGSFLSSPEAVDAQSSSDHLALAVETLKVSKDSVFGKRLKFHRTLERFDEAGASDVTKEISEEVVVDIRDAIHFKYSRAGGSKGFDATKLYYGGNGHYLTEKVNEKLVFITSFSPESLYQSLPLSAGWLLEMKTLEFGRFNEDGAFEIRLMSGTVSFLFNEGAVGQVIRRDSKGRSVFNWTDLSREAGAGSFMLRKFTKGKVFSEETWRWVSSEDLTEGEMAVENFVYKFQPGFSVIDYTNGNPISFTSDELLNAR